MGWAEVVGGGRVRMWDRCCSRRNRTGMLAGEGMWCQGECGVVVLRGMWGYGVKRNVGLCGVKRNAGL